MNFLRTIAGMQHGTAVAPPTVPYIISQTSNNGIGGTYTVATPSGTGGLLVLSLQSPSDGSGPTTQAWIQIQKSATGLDNGTSILFYRVASGTEGSTISGPSNSGGIYGWSVVCSRVGGIDLTNPIAASNVARVTASSASPTMTLTYGGITTPVANCLVIVSPSVCDDVGGIVGAFTPPAGFTNGIAGGEPAGKYASVAMSSKVFPAAGATGAATGTVAISAATNGFTVLGVALRPAAVTPPPPPAGAIAGTDVTILANSDDSTSAAMASAYATAWGISPGNIVTVSLGSTESGVTTTQINNARTAIATAGRQYTQMAMQVPSRTAAGQSITSAITFGIRTVSDLTVSSLYNYTGFKPFTDIGVRPSFLLRSSSYIQASTVLNHGTSYMTLAKDTPGDTPPNTRGSARAGQTAPGLVIWDARSSTVGAGSNPCSELSTGCTSYSGYPNPILPVCCAYQSSYLLHAATGIPFLAGMYADHLTSFGGWLPDGNSGSQTPLTWELDRGASASCGTVSEPGQANQTGFSNGCLTEQFVNVTIFDPLFKANKNVGMAVWSSVKCPDRALMAGDLMFKAAF